MIDIFLQGRIGFVENGSKKGYDGHIFNGIADFWNELLSRPSRRFRFEDLVGTTEKFGFVACKASHQF